MPASLEDLLATVPGELENLSSGVSSAYQRSADFAKEAASLPQRLREAISKKWQDNQDLIENRNKSLTDYYTAGATARENYQNIFNPFTREKLVTQFREQAGEKARNFTDLLTQRGAKIEDIVGNTSDLFSGEVNAANILANAAQSRFADAMQIANWKSGVTGQIESNKRADEQMKMTKENQDFSKLFDVLQISGGDINVGGKNYHIPGYEEQLRIKERITGGGGGAAKAAQTARETVQAMAKSGATLNSVMGTGTTMGLDANSILNIYNGNSIYGPALETPQTLEKNYGIKRGELDSSKSTGDKLIEALVNSGQISGASASMK